MAFTASTSLRSNTAATVAGVVVVVVVSNAP